MYLNFFPHHPPLAYYLKYFDKRVQFTRCMNLLDGGWGCNGVPQREGGLGRVARFLPPAQVSFGTQVAWRLRALQACLLF